MTLNGVISIILRYFTSANSVASGAHCAKVVEDHVVVKKFTFASSSADEFLVCQRQDKIADSTSAAERRRVAARCLYRPSTQKTRQICISVMSLLTGRNDSLSSSSIFSRRTYSETMSNYHHSIGRIAALYVRRCGLLLQTE